MHRSRTGPYLDQLVGVRPAGGRILNNQDPRIAVAALGSASYAQNSQKDWWRLYHESQSGKHCVGGDDEGGGYPSWMVCHRR
jgi:hypothetical protein